MIVRRARCGVEGITTEALVSPEAAGPLASARRRRLPIGSLLIRSVAAMSIMDICNVTLMPGAASYESVMRVTLKASGIFIWRPLRMTSV